MLDKRQWKRFGLALLLAVLTLTVAGCNLIDRLQAWKQGSEEQQAVLPADQEKTANPEDLLTGETRQVVLYFSNQNGEDLVAESRGIPQVEGIARATMQELLAGPSVESGLLPTIPLGTTISDINIRPDGLCVVDFSGELMENHPGGSLNEELTVYSIVNTLTQFPSVQEVQILVDGQQVESIAGHMDVSTTMIRNEEIINDK